MYLIYSISRKFTSTNLYPVAALPEEDGRNDSTL